MVDERGVGERFGLLAAHLDERSKRLWAGAEAISLGYGGTEAVVRANGIAATTIRRGIADLRAGEVLEGRARRRGGGRRRIVDADPGVLEDLDRLADDGERGDPERPLFRALPALRPQVACGEDRKVDRLATVRFCSARYSVPHRLVGQTVQVAATDRDVVIIHAGVPVAQHELLAPGEASPIRTTRRPRRQAFAR